jgi:ribosomal protein L29
MKRKELNDLRTKDLKALSKMAMEKKFEVKKNKMAMLGGKEKNLKVTNNLRHDLAQILTVMKEKEILEKIQSKKEETLK